MSMALLWTSGMLSPESLLLDQQAWLLNAYRVFATRLRGPEPAYPCHLGVQGQLKGHNWFTALDETSPGWGVSDLAGTINEFRRHAWQGPKRQSLVVFVGPPEQNPDLDRDTERFWSVLSRLSTSDEVPWPTGHAADTRDPQWQWCFAGEPWFVFGCSPAYVDRHSRDVGPCLTLVFQVRRVFEGLSGASPTGQAAKRKIRDQLLAYDTVGVHPHLGDPTQSSVFKWRQYMLPDDQQTLSEESCPFQDLVREKGHGG